MQKLNVRFPDKTKQEISKLAKSTKMSDSVVARSALNIGLAILTRESLKGNSNLIGMIKICHNVQDKEKDYQVV